MAVYDVRAGDVPRSMFRTGRVKFSLGVPVSTPEQRRASKKDLPDVYRRMQMEVLRARFAWDVLHAIQTGRFHVAEVVRRMKVGGEAAIREMQHELATPEPEVIPEAPVTFKEKKESYLKWYKSVRAESSHATRKSRLDAIGRMPGEQGTLIDEIPFSKLTSKDIAAALDLLEVGPVTRESYRLSISAVYTHESKLERERAEKEQREPRWLINPASLVERIEDDDEDDVRAATNEEVQRILAASEPYQAAYVLISTQVGVRQGEYQHLRYKLDLDLETGMLRVQKRGPDPCCRCKKCAEKGWKPKNKRGTRSVHIPDELQALRTALLRLLEMYPVKDGEILFRNPRTGRPWTTKALQDDFKALCERADVVYGRDVPDGITWHSMRHTCATNLVRAGVQLKKVADILGDTVETVEKYYVNLDESDLGRGLALGAAVGMGG